ISGPKNEHMSFEAAMAVISGTVGYDVTVPQTRSARLDSHSALAKLVTTQKEIKDLSPSIEPSQVKITTDYLHGQKRSVGFDVAEGQGVLRLSRNSGSQTWKVDKVIFIPR